ncbi:MAG: polysaccharide biosynthesis tyrosine autokinase [Sedimentisphaerales bacterium]|nr:polysaccharide biosynthesis tyrosine autokinase [Sedimentisphaerales bacterium]
MAEDRPAALKRKARPAAPRPGSIPPTSASLTPKEAFCILRRHIFLIVCLTVLGFVAGGGGWKLLQKYFPRYTARTYIQVLPPVEKDPMTIGSVQLHKDILYGHRQSIANLIKQQRTLEELLDRDKVKETHWFVRRDRDRRKAVKYLKRYFGAHAHRDSEFVEISMTCGSATEAAEIVNEMHDLFLSRQGVTEKQEITERLQRLEEQRIRVQSELDAAEKGLDDVRVAYDLTDLDRPMGRYFQHPVEVKLNNLELQKDELDLVIRQLHADLANLEELATGPITEQIEVAIEKDPVMVDLAQQITFWETQLSGLLIKFGENHRDVRQARERLEETKKKRAERKDEIANQIRRANLENAKSNLIVLQERFEELEQLRQEAVAKKKQLDLARIQFDKGVKIRDERLEMLDTIKEQIEKLKTLHDDPETPKVLSVGKAPPPLEMVFSRQWWLWFPSGTLMGLLLGVGLAFLIELANDLVRTPSDVARYLHIPLLGVIPDAMEDRQVRRIELCHAVRLAPHSVISESYRQCRTNLMMSDDQESVKTLLVTSGKEGEGKTSVAVNLATTFATAEKKVLLIDANFRQPHLHALFPKLETKPSVKNFNFGLSSLLTRQCTNGKAIRSSGIEGLDVIDCGPLPANPADLLGSSRMEELLRNQSKKYDYIIIDGPPVLLFSDAKMLAGLVDATILVFNAMTTRRGAAQRAIRELREVNAILVGGVLFAARSIRGGYFQEQYKSYRRYQKKVQVAAGTV